MPHAGEPIRPIPGIDPMPNALSLSGHVAGHTRALMPFETMLRDGSAGPATYIHLWRSETDNALATAWYADPIGSGPVLDLPP